MKFCAIIQARMGSTRLPGKAMADICGNPAIWHLMKQLRYASKLDQVILATTTNPLDDSLVAYARLQKWHVFRGSEDDVLDRYYKAAKRLYLTDKDIIIRITGDDILVDPGMVEQLVDLLVSNLPRVEHVSNNRIRSFPYGADVEVFSFSALERAWKEAKFPNEREHVTPYIRNHPEIFRYLDLRSPVDYSSIYLSIDSPEDLRFNQEIFKRLYETSQPPFHLQQIINCINRYKIKHKRMPL
jgi:spore coat polysaccharide biosynthesis protein SpsF